MTLIPKRALKISAPLVVLLAVATASGQTTPCPVDGMRLPLPIARPWNDAGGTDSDGCRWSIDSEGRWGVAGLDAVVACPKCHAAFRFDHLPLPLTREESARVREAASAMPSGDLQDPAHRFRLAAATYQALGPARLKALGLDTDVFLGELLLEGAWAARARAVLPGFDTDYRPRDLPHAHSALEGLEDGLRRGRRRRGGLDPLLRRVEQLRTLARQVEGLPGPAAATLSDRLAESLIRLEQALYALRKSQPTQQATAGSAADDYLALARACARYGDPTRRRAWQESARARFGKVVEARLLAFGDACALEAELLQEAETRFAAAALSSDHSPGRQADLSFLAGDCARRRGDKATAAQHLQRARQLAPGSRTGKNAAFLLGKD